MTNSRKMTPSKAVFLLLSIILIAQGASPARLRAWRFDPLSDLVHAHIGRSIESTDAYAAPFKENAQQPDFNGYVSPSSVVSIQGRPLLFSDDFEGTTLDESRWNPHYWWHDEEDGCTIVPNNELQWYQPDDVLVSNGILRLRAQKRPIVTCGGETYNYTSGVITSGADDWAHPAGDKFAFTYGYAEARLKMPLGQGLWPAFWFLPCDQEWPPEVDVMEFLGDRPSITHMTYHYLDDSGNYAEQGDWWVSPHDFSAEWHTFGLDWRPDAMIWYVDGVERYRYTDQRRIPSEPMYLVLNLAVGGDWPGPPDASTVFPSYFEVDYVKVWGERTVDPSSLTEQVFLPQVSRRG